MKLLIFILLFGLQVFAQVLPQKTISSLSFSQRNFAYMSNFPLMQPNEAITQAVIVVHGSALNFENYFDTMQLIAKKNQLENSMLVISPHYRTLTEAPLAPATDLVWTDEGWLSGDVAFNAEVSAFTVIDQFMRLLNDKKMFPNLKVIVLTGHSAGGQLTQRYAIGTQIENEITDKHLRYIVANPGSYAYLNNKRLDQSNPGQFNVPKNPGCAYNNYKYGLDNANEYMTRSSQDNMVTKYIEKDVIYLLGEADTLTEDFDLTCSALLQGPNRYVRGSNFKDYLDFEYPNHKHRKFSVPNVGHTQRGMYTSPSGIDALLNGY